MKACNQLYDYLYDNVVFSHPYNVGAKITITVIEKQFIEITFDIGDDYSVHDAESIYRVSRTLRERLNKLPVKWTPDWQYTIDGRSFVWYKFIVMTEISAEELVALLELYR